jgi:hypothetical protein
LNQNVWNPLVGFNSPYLGTSFITTDVVQGTMYSFKLRAQNELGWSGWSQVTTIMAASVPSKMNMVTVSTGVISPTNVLISFSAPNTSGSVITGYKIEIQSSDSQFYESAVCIGSSESVMNQLSCEVPMPSLLTDPYNLS